MQKHGFGFVVILASAALMTGCSSYDKHQAAQAFLDGATNSAEEREKQAEQLHQKPDSSLLPDVINGVLNVGLQWLVSSEDPSN
ncbi:MAG: hypothetical protein KJ556_14100 [Gammaproteobacteria bacterium]|nr:hypothetical protein [Gammaproteobacteria bacterium]MBU2057489.1 hypothetical protein [Gammaproteobacteria bacterium]MBU2176249.1 hypothetical protein [Gammaproteobacteria bacterium]MBU2245850.1 hypothetical protein [Gammaproteobacteria bacterium]MBU2343124.1 hypothetical protein [Gammaproteobacteria bacterium]